MGTTWHIELFASPDRADVDLRADIEQELARLVSQMSHWREDSDLSKFNRAAAGQWVRLPADLFSVLEAALATAKLTGCAFDPTLGFLVDMWGFGPRQEIIQVPPPPNVLAHEVSRCGANRISLDATQASAFQPGGVSLDLSAIAKGYAVDRIAKLLARPDISSCLVEIGGELNGRGVKPDGQPWWVTIERPPGEEAREGFPEISIALCGLSIASSGDYRRYFEHRGVRYTHTIDPLTGSPIRHPIASVTVLHDQCMMADAYSTALAVLGPEEGLAFADRHNLAALFVLRIGTDYQPRPSSLLRRMLQD